MLAPGGLLAGFFFFGDGERGPPFPLRCQEELDDLLAGAFERTADLPVEESVPVFAQRERWQVWEKRP